MSTILPVWRHLLFLLRFSASCFAFNASASAAAFAAAIAASLYDIMQW
ncbi:MAG: hypothetical protein LBH00_09790 [Planctomycetaceae bacterium]|nr:hypothetical protein [Planctomycetaceae bacterium]